MGIQFIDFDSKKHNGVIKEFHCKVNYSSNTYSPGKRPSYDKYRQKWLLLEGEQFFEYICGRFERNEILIKMIVSGENSIIGYFYADLVQSIEWDVYKAEIGDIFVEDSYRKQGIGTKILDTIEKECRRKGINLIRSGTGAHNIGSVRLHEKAGFVISRYEYEKWL